MDGDRTAYSLPLVSSFHWNRGCFSIKDLYCFDFFLRSLYNYFQIFYDDYQSDAPDTKTLDDICPPIPPELNSDACALQQCKSDTDCENDFRCCYNGCVYSCLPEVKPSPCESGLVAIGRIKPVIVGKMILYVFCSLVLHDSAI